MRIHRVLFYKNLYSTIFFIPQRNTTSSAILITAYSTTMANYLPCEISNNVEKLLYFYSSGSEERTNAELIKFWSECIWRYCLHRPKADNIFIFTKEEIENAFTIQDIFPSSFSAANDSLLTRIEGNGLAPHVLSIDSLYPAENAYFNVFNLANLFSSKLWLGFDREPSCRCVFSPLCSASADCIDSYLRRSNESRAPGDGFEDVQENVVFSYSTANEGTLPQVVPQLTFSSLVRRAAEWRLGSCRDASAPDAGDAANEEDSAELRIAQLLLSASEDSIELLRRYMIRYKRAVVSRDGMILKIVAAHGCVEKSGISAQLQEHEHMELCMSDAIMRIQLTLQHLSSKRASNTEKAIKFKVSEWIL